MDDYYITDTNTVNLLIQDDRCDWLSGKDFYINFIGNYGHYFCPDHFDLYIWENGKEGGSGDYFVDKVTAPTCEAKGYTTHTCAYCGKTEQEEIPRLDIIYSNANGDNTVNTMDLILLRQCLAG